MKAKILYPAGSELIDFFHSEDKNILRSTFSVAQIGDDIVFEVEAQDAVGLRTTLATICKNLIVWEKSKQL